MSARYLEVMSQPNQSKDVRVHDLIVDGTYTGPSGTVPDPLTITTINATTGNIATVNATDVNTTNLDVSGNATIGTIEWTKREAPTNSVAQATSPTTAVTLNTENGIITTQSMTTVPSSGLGAVATTFAFNNNLMDANTVCLVKLIQYTGNLPGANGLPVVDCFYDGTPTQRVIRVSNIGESNLAGVLQIWFELVHQI